MPRSLDVDVVNIVERRAAPANHQGVRFSVATNGKFTVATNSMAALDRCTEYEGPIHLLLTDMMMPGMTGHQLAERFVRLRPDTSVMFVSGHPEAEVGDDTLIGRRVSLLRKPFSSDELVERVIQVVEKAA